MNAKHLWLGDRVTCEEAVDLVAHLGQKCLHGREPTLLVLTATRQLALTGKRYALATMCIGVGQGMAMVIEAV